MHYRDAATRAFEERLQSILKVVITGATALGQLSSLGYHAACFFISLPAGFPRCWSVVCSGYL
ncbi:hypothetical protein ELY33_04925 [Vreelandella andesensis]|uniref:Uncharacterized protein n=1 Tax=Vreelandella andesensis TaxID=447567 RepID=A0A3S1DRV6_9GAMM|nr:hypothetical protein [Halomonas andesensis]RUR32728.1 hypothetical protein ELY33_04925 [Halomonas andesensis]